MVEDVRRFAFQNVQRHLHPAAEIRDQHFDLDVRAIATNLANAVGEMLRSAITQVIAIHGRHHDVIEPHLGNGFRQFARLVLVERIGSPMRDIAEGATAGTDIAHDHEGRRPATEALA